ncbi:MAG: hypothetical protein CBD08_004425 [Cellvibrionales bacterium TMED148]|nr:hypothetical protein [Porticoccaceae bacterium]RPG90776.1 MAG: hypothetical protein CBD08_004425 [Cellvibrionales bacterium TMED148]
MRPSLSDRLSAGEVHPFDQILEYWDIDSSQYYSFESKVTRGWRDLKAKKRETWPARGYEHCSEMNDEQLTDSLHTVIFPNITMSFLPDNIIFLDSLS